MAKVICVLYDDPVSGYPKSYARDDIPKLERYPDGQTLPTPKKIDFKPSYWAVFPVNSGCASFLRISATRWSSPRTRTVRLGVGERTVGCGNRYLAAVWPAYITAARIAKAPKLKMAITAGIGSDHVDLQAAMDRGMTVAEVTYCNSISVSEHVVMMILSLVRNYIPSYQWVVKAAGTSPTVWRGPTTWKE